MTNPVTQSLYDLSVPCRNMTNLVTIWLHYDPRPSLFLLAGLQSAITPTLRIQPSWNLVCGLRQQIGTDCNCFSPTPSFSLLAGLQSAVTPKRSIKSSWNLVYGLRRPIGTDCNCFSPAPFSLPIGWASNRHNSSSLHALKPKFGLWT